MKLKAKKYTALAELSMAYKVEFYDSDIPKGMTAEEYADQLAENGAYEECENGGDFQVYQIHEESLHPRKCVECGEGMQEGYLGADGGTWCSDKCLFADGYTPEQYAIDHENGDCFWTDWKEESE